MASPRSIAAWILAAGFTAALAIYVTAAPPEEPLADGRVTKQYLRQMETYGGSANVLATELREWFAGLWHGRELAFTVAGLSVLVAAYVLVQATPLPPTDARR